MVFLHRITSTLNMSSSNGVDKLVLVFDGWDFRLWQEKNSDYFKSQWLWKYISGAFPHPAPADAAAPTVAETAAMAEWDEIDEQVHAIIAMRLSSNLWTHLGSAQSPRTAKMALDSLVASFGQMGISGLIADFHRATFSKVSGMQNPQVEIQAIHTLWECLWANQIVIPDYIQGMLLLGAVRGHLCSPIPPTEYVHLDTPDTLRLANSPYIPPHWCQTPLPSGSFVHASVHLNSKT